MSKMHKLHSMFFPGSVAVVGASANAKGFGGTGFIKNLQAVGFPGKLYPINKKAQDVVGLKAYSSLRAIPEPPDFVIIAIPAPGVPGVLEDCVASGVRNVHIFSSGFDETGEKEGRQLERRIVEIIRQGHLNVVGPNCMGLWVPASKLIPWGARLKGAGSLAFLSQSGGHGEIITGYAQSFGVYFSKLISFGNAKGLQVTDYLEYLAQDPDTEMIAIYLEGIKDGNRVTQLVKEINRSKPVMVWKGGLTASGSRAVASHTGSMAGEEKIWQAFFAQTGAIRVNSLEEIVDVALAFLHLPPPRGNRALLLGGGGGNSVAYADICSRNGLDVPPLSDDTRNQLNAFIRLAGNSTRNPLDVWDVQDDTKLLRRTMELAVADPAIDLAIVDQMVGDFFDEGDDNPNREENERQQREATDLILDFAKTHPEKKPLVVTINMYGGDLHKAGLAIRQRQKFAMAGVPAYGTPESAARALARYVQYHEFHRSRHPDWEEISK
jgi:acyl-CoA synthetase (NDP forming)